MNFKKLIIALILPQLAGIIGSVFTISSIPTWYATLNKPFFNPPNWVFGPVWILLYFLMGISLYLVWESKKENKKALRIFGIQLALNTLWSIVFFGFHSPIGALIVIFALLMSIAVTILEFMKISKKVGYLLIPYILWTSFATLLNFAIFLLN